METLETLDDIDMEEFINEIEIRPALWNTKCAVYNDFLEKEVSWDALYNKFIKDYKNKTADEKNHAGYLLKRKWRDLRDSYAKTFYKQKKLKSRGITKKIRKSAYYDRLTFLAAVQETRVDKKENSSSSKDSSKPSTSIPFPLKGG